MLPTTTATTTYLYANASSYEQRCFESKGLADLEAKRLKGEQFTDEDAARVSTCVEEREKATSYVLIGGLILIALIIVIGVIVTW